MSHVKNDLEALENFRDSLKATMERVREDLAQLYIKFTDLESVWNDSQYKGYSELYVQLEKEFKDPIRFNEELVLQYLGRLIEKIEEYLNIGRPRL